MSRTLNVAFTSNAWNDYLYLQKNDRKTIRQLNRLIDSACRDPFKGIGKPEPLKYLKSGTWSRRIDKANRMVYRVTDTEIIIVQCRFHYTSK